MFISFKVKLFKDVINKIAQYYVEQSLLMSQVPPAVHAQASVPVYIAARAARPSVQCSVEYREVPTQPSHQEKHVES